MNDGAAADERLMAGVVHGSPGDLAPLMRRYAVPLLTFLARMLNDHHRAEEQFQEVFLQVWLKRHTFRDGRPFRPWLFAIAANACRSALRKRKPETVWQASEELPQIDGLEPDELLARRESADQVSAAVAELPERQREVVVLRIWNELSFAEIAAAMGCTEGTARAHMHHGLASLRKRLEALEFSHGAG